MNKEMDKPTLMERLVRHDWYYAYSDDHRVWKAGQAEGQKLQGLMADLHCPYTLHQLRMAVQNMVVEEFAENSPNAWYRQPQKYKNIAPVRRSELIHHADQVLILAWIEHQVIS